MTDVISVPKYHVPEDSLIQGSSLHGFLTGLMSEDIRPHLEEVLADYGYDIDEIDPTGWYPLSITMDVSRALVEKTRNALILVSVGTGLVDSLELPGEIDSIPTSIELLIQFFHNETDNVPPEHGYHSLSVEENRVTFVDHTPFPHDMVYGYVYGLARRFSPEDVVPIVERTYLNPDEPDSDGAFYEITW